MLEGAGNKWPINNWRFISRQWKPSRCSGGWLMDLVRLEDSYSRRLSDKLGLTVIRKVLSEICCAIWHWKNHFSTKTVKFEGRGREAVCNFCNVERNVVTRLYFSMPLLGLNAPDRNSVLSLKWYRIHNIWGFLFLYIEETCRHVNFQMKLVLLAVRLFMPNYQIKIRMSWDVVHMSLWAKLFTFSAFWKCNHALRYQFGLAIATITPVLLPWVVREKVWCIASHLLTLSNHWCKQHASSHSSRCLRASSARDKATRRNGLHQFWMK